MRSRRRSTPAARTDGRGTSSAHAAASRYRSSVGREREQRRDAGALDGGLQLPLMQRAGAGDAARKDLTALGDELLEGLDVLEVDVLDLLDAELTDAFPAIEELLLAALLAAGAGRAVTAVARARCGCCCHMSSPSALSA